MRHIACLYSKVTLKMASQIQRKSKYRINIRLIDNANSADINNRNTIYYRGYGTGSVGSSFICKKDPNELIFPYFFLPCQTLMFRILPVEAGIFKMSILCWKNFCKTDSDFLDISHYPILMLHLLHFHGRNSYNNHFYIDAAFFRKRKDHNMKQLFFEHTSSICSDLYQFYSFLTLQSSVRNLKFWEWRVMEIEND